MLQVRCALAVRVQAACGAYKLAGRRRCCHRRTAGRQAGTPRRQIAAGMQSTDLLQNGGRQRLRHLHMGRADKRVLEGGAQNSTATAADGAAVVSATRPQVATVCCVTGAALDTLVAVVAS